MTRSHFQLVGCVSLAAAVFLATGCEPAKKPAPEKPGVKVDVDPAPKDGKADVKVDVDPAPKGGADVKVDVK